MNKNCTVNFVSELIGKKWTILILLEIYKGKNNIARFQEIKNKIPNITSKILSERLNELIEVGIVVNKITSERFPIISEYSLTKSGLAFIDIIKQMKLWALKFKVKNKICSMTECENCNI